MCAQSEQRLAHYRLLEQIGEGGMGVVWRALDTRLDREVAIKFLPERFEADAAWLARFEREARTLAALNHPGIVTVHSVEEAEGRHFLTMEMVRGEPLSRLIPEAGFPLKTLAGIGLPLLEAVAAAHERGIVHGDLKPANVLVGPGGRVKILDFGLARMGARPAAVPAGAPAEVAAGSSVSMTQATTQPLAPSDGISGTLHYMSPERVRGEPADHRTDIWSLGVVLHEMATGRPPFQGGGVPEVIASILKDDPPPVDEIRPDLPRALGRVIRHCLRKDPRERMQSVLDVRSDLEEIAREARAGRSDEAPSIAVLPFTDMSQAKDQDYFCEGIAEEIINALTGLKGLRVVSRTTSFQFRQAALESPEIGRRLRVATVLEGSVRKAGDRVRVSVELTDVARGFILWAGRYDRDMRDIFAIQEEIARSIVMALRVTLSPGEARALGRKQTLDVRAYDYYLRGRKYYDQYRRRGIEFALRMFSQAIEADPDYGLAYAGIADCHSFLYLHAERLEEHRRGAEEASQRALDLAPGMAQVHASRGLALSLGGRQEEAEKEFEMAVRLEPTLFEAHYFFARHCFAAGQFDKAIRLFEQAEAVRPEDYQAPLLVAQIHIAQGHPDRARATRLRGLRLAEERLKLAPDDARAWYMGANALVGLGETERGLEWARRAQEMDPDEPMLLYNIGCIRSLAGQVDEAIDCLEKSIQHGLTIRSWFEHDSDLDALRSRPRFRALMARLP